MNQDAWNRGDWQVQSKGRGLLTDAVQLVVPLDGCHFAIQSNRMTAPQFNLAPHVAEGGGGSGSTRGARWASVVQYLRSLPGWSRVILWVAALLSPSGYFLALMIADRLHVTALPGGLVVALFCLVPLMALLACGALVWTSQATRRSRAAWMVLTVLAWLFECALLFVIIVSAITAAISLP